MLPMSVNKRHNRRQRQRCHKWRNCYSSERQVSELEGYCLTPGCVKAAASLINTIDETVDPCTGTRGRGHGVHSVDIHSWYSWAHTARKKIGENLNLNVHIFIDGVTGAEWKSEIVDISIILFSVYAFHLHPVNKYSLKIKLSQIFSISVHILSQNSDVFRPGKRSYLWRLWLKSV